METILHRYKTIHYFSSTARLFGWMATAFAVLSVYNGSVAAWVLLPAGFITQFTYRRTEIDLTNRTYRTGVLLAGITFGKMQHLAGVDFLYLNKNKYNHTAESRASTAQFRSIKYDGFLKLADGTKLHLVQEHTKEKALQLMEKISDDLGIELRDQTNIKYF
ncbi:hypothetical protein [uncultured Pontibacter sp.]|uniref:hypothetical protein n=1 Tax=uncultured Pontibacter sp. TaxID=453356 RepID=UPI00262C769D|nr:hypothetical protein [uncultured Pontibacter sp.]